MKQTMRIGLRLESLGLPLREALVEASRIGVGGVQIDAVGDLAPGQLSQSGRRDFRNVLRSHGLELTALACPLRRGLDAAEDQGARLEHVCEVMTLACDLGPRVALVQACEVPANEDEAAARRLREGLLALGRHAGRVGATLALEAGPQSGETLARYLGTFDVGGLAANLDAASLLSHGFDPVRAVAELVGRIAHVHARDARKGSAGRAAQEVPLGQGDVNWLGFLGALREADYCGWLVVERGQGEDRPADVQRGVAFLRAFVA